MKIKQKCKMLFGAVLALVFLSLPAHAQTGVAAALSAADAGTCATANACLVLPVTASTGAAGFAISTNASGNTIQFEATADYGITYVALSVTPANSTTTVTSTTSTGTWQANVAGYTHVRMRCSTFVAGTTATRINSSTASARAGGGGGGGGAVSSVFTRTGAVVAAVN